jgi:hypothetical protein
MNEEWPIYHRGRRDHIHALGVIALGYSAFERGLVTIYAHHCAQQHMPYELVHLYYSSLNEKSQLEAIKTTFASCIPWRSSRSRRVLRICARLGKEECGAFNTLPLLALA